MVQKPPSSRMRSGSGRQGSTCQSLLRCGSPKAALVLLLQRRTENGQHVLVLHHLLLRVLLQ